MDPFLHALGVFLQMALVILHPALAGLALGLGWLLREAAQANRGNLLAALHDLPRWPLHKQLEWIVPLVVASSLGAGWSALAGIGFFWRHV